MRIFKLFILPLALAGLAQASLAIAQIQPAPTVKPAVTAAAKGATVNPNDGYEIGPEDVVEIDVLGQQDFHTRAKVKTDGTLPLPYIGSMNVSGYTPVRLADAVAAKLRSQGIYEKPVVNVEVVSYASRYVIALGELGSPGLVPVDRAYRLSEILARVGGMRSSGAPYVILTREGQASQQYNFQDLAKGGDSSDPWIQPGDKIFVPLADKFYIYGAISAPGEYPLSEKLSVRKALARAGGVTANGSEKRLKIFHDGNQIKPVELERDVQPGDVIVVGERLF